MKNNDLLRLKLEQLNKMYLDDDYYNFGKSMKKIFVKIKKIQIISIFRILFLHNYKLKNRIKTEDIIYKKVDSKKNKIVIYTCITGNYDRIYDPLLIEDNIEYVLFTNNRNIKSNIWKIVMISDEISKRCMNNNMLINRYIKMHPHLLFNDYDYSIYIDGNIQIISTISDFVSCINKNSGIAIHRHCAFDCIYLEQKNCLAEKKGNKKNLKKQIKMYKSKGFPKKFGLFECNILVCDLKSEDAKLIFNEWWNDFILFSSYRDQISLPYVLWKNGYSSNDVGLLGYNVNKNYKIKINVHI